MKIFLFIALLTIGAIHAKSQSGDEKMSATIFKYQKYIRAELERFDFDVHFSIVSATVYFTGANFKGVENGFIKGPSLKEVEHLMARCIPGSIVMFDDVKVIGPDKEVRTIPGLSLMLR